MLNCTTGTMDGSHFNKWTPLTGMYIASASLVCAIAIIGDLVEGLWSKQYWIPSGYASLNSLSLTILGAATKLSMDLSTTMPRQIDQLAKLGTSAFMCIALASIHPSLGKLENGELLSNTVALSILVISSIASICIQLRSGVICTFKTAHVIMLTMMSLLLLHCVLSAGLLSFFKSIYQNNYEEQDQSARKKWIDVEDNKHPRTEKLKQYLKRFSMLAQFSCPHFLLGRSSQGTPPMIYGLVAAITFFVTQITSVTHGHKFLASTLCSRSNSAYNWSALWIFMIQTIAIGVGTIVLCIRGCYIAVVYLKGVGSPIRFKMDYIAGLGQYGFGYTVYAKHKSLFYKSKMILLSFSQYLFRSFLAVISSLTLIFIEGFWRGITYVCYLTTRRCIACKLPQSPSPTTQPKDLASEVEELSRQFISTIIALESEGLVKWTMKSILDLTQTYMSAKERNTEHIEELLRHYLSANFRGVVSFDSEEVAPLYSQGSSPPNCWSLPLVTITCIAIALPNVNPDSIDMLIKGVNEGLVFAKLIEDKFLKQPHFLNVCYAAYVKWTRSFGPLGETRARHTFQDNNPIAILEVIGQSAKDHFHAHTADADRHERVAAHSSYRLCETLLMEYRNENESAVQPSCERLFEKLRATIADILGACLINLKHYILTECSKCSSIVRAREAALSILTFFGDTEGIMKIIEAKEIPEMSMEKMVFIDNWREYYQPQSQNQLPLKQGVDA